MTDQTCCGACGYPVHATKEMACDWCRQAADRIEALTANLTKAVEALEYYAVEALPWEADDSLRARTTLAEIKGGNDAKSDL